MRVFGVAGGARAEALNNKVKLIGTAHMDSRTDRRRRDRAFGCPTSRSNG